MKLLPDAYEKDWGGESGGGGGEQNGESPPNPGLG